MTKYNLHLEDFDLILADDTDRKTMLYTVGYSHVVLILGRETKLSSEYENSSWWNCNHFLNVSKTPFKYFSQEGMI